MKIVTLDIATTVGFAHGDSAGRPSFGVKKLQSGGRAIFQLLYDYRQWLSAFLAEQDPDLVMFEKPLLFASRGQPEMTLYKLICMAGETEVVAGLQGARCQWVPINTLKLHFAGYGRAKKPEMMNVARQLGYAVEDGNEADAIALFSYAVACHDPANSHRWTRMGAVA